MQGLPFFKEINDIHIATGTALRTNNPLMHCFNMEDANDLQVESLPPHRAGFYTLALNSGTQRLDFTINDTHFHHPEQFLLFVAPGQVAKWEKKGTWRGYALMFKDEFLPYHSPINFLQQYPFFNINETNLLSIDEVTFETISTHYKQILKEQAHPNAFSEEIMRSNLQSILWLARRVYEQKKGNTAAQRGRDGIAAQFQYLVNEYFLEKHTVEEYAQLLNITPNHLSQTIRQATGNTAKSIISERRLNEAKYLLTYTREDIAEIAFYLHFPEATHFTKFFKKASGQTPLNYRLKSSN